VSFGALCCSPVTSDVCGTWIDKSRFSSIRLLLTNTLVPRDTKTLVAGVSKKLLDEPETTEGLLKSIAGISGEAKGLLGESGAGADREALVKRLEVGIFICGSMWNRRCMCDLRRATC
jgi:hypothetical protein